jgi:hypothetical protein
MNTSSLTNCQKRIQEFEKTHYQNVEQTLFLKDYFYDWNEKVVKLQCNASKEEKKRYLIPKKYNKWPTKPIKGVSAQMPLNETNDFPGFDHDDNDEKI